MKRLIPILLLFSLLLASCGSPSPAAAPRKEQPAPVTAAPTEPSAASSPVPVVIRDAFCEMGNYRDDVGNSWDYVLRLPMIETEGADALRLNRELYDALYPAVKDAQDSMAGAYSLAVTRVDYTVYVNGQLISILCEIDTNWGFESYYTVNFDASDYTEVKRAELLQRFGLAEDSFPDVAAARMEAWFREEYEAVPQDEMYRDRHDKSVAPGNFLQDCSLYVNDSGKLCMIPKLYSFAGADYYYHIFEIAGP